MMNRADVELLETGMKDRLRECRDDIGTPRQILVRLEVVDLVGSGQLSTQAFTLYCCLLRHVMTETLTTMVSRKSLTIGMHFMRTRALDIHLDALIDVGLVKARETHGGVEYTLGLVPLPGRWD